MSLSDPIGDMIARVKMLKQEIIKVELPSSNFKVKIAIFLRMRVLLKILN